MFKDIDKTVSIKVSYLNWGTESRVRLLKIVECGGESVVEQCV